MIFQNDHTPQQKHGQMVHPFDKFERTTDPRQPGLMLGGLFGSVCSIDITFDAEQNRKTAALGEGNFPQKIRGTLS